MSANLNALGPFSQNIQHLWQISQTRAVQQVSYQVFDFLPAKVQKSLVDAEILTTLYLQDEDTPDARIRELLNLLVEANNAVYAEQEVDA